MLVRCDLSPSISVQTFPGETKLESASGDRPIANTWRLENAIAGGLFRELSTLAQG